MFFTYLRAASVMPSVTISFKARDYQKPVVKYFRDGGKHAYCVWHRKAGKDRVATFVESDLACERVGLYWHALPRYEDARKVVWDAITPDGLRLIDVNFPPQIVKRRLDHEMKLELVNGSIWQPVGADNFNALVGAFPKHITYSEYPLMNPRARDFLRPALAMNDGTELIIGTPRGYNHGHDLWQYAKGRTGVGPSGAPEWFTSLLTVDDTGVLTPDILEEERRSMPDELFRQEYYCDWSAANVGAILGRYVEAAEKEGRIHDAVDFDPDGAPLEISSDIGRRHISAWWFWQPRLDGFALVDYDEDSGLDAGEWIERLKTRLTALVGEERAGTALAALRLPHDARAKTFAAKHSAVEQFVTAFGHDKVSVTPQTKKEHSINAGQVVMRRCSFHRTRCAKGLAALRAWSYAYDDERKSFSKAPVDDWSCDAADAFCEGAKVMVERQGAKVPARRSVLAAGAASTLTMDEMWRAHERSLSRRARI